MAAPTREEIRLAVVRAWEREKLGDELEDLLAFNLATAAAVDLTDTVPRGVEVATDPSRVGGPRSNGGLPEPARSAGQSRPSSHAHSAAMRRSASPRKQASFMFQGTEIEGPRPRRHS